MYVACRTLKVQQPPDPKTGKSVARLVKPGEAVPEAGTWPYGILIAHLNLEYLKWDSPEKAPHEAHKGLAVVVPMIFKEMAPKPKQNTQTGGEPKASPQVSTDLSCAECGGKKFKNIQGLKSHRAQKHADSEQPRAG